MKRKTVRSLREGAYFSSIGLSVALSIFIGAGIGVYLERKWPHTSPWLMLICLGLGIAAGYRNIGLAIKKVQRENWKETDSKKGSKYKDSNK